MKNKIWIYIGFFALLLIGFYIALDKLVGLQTSTLPVINNVRSFSFVNQDGKTITEKDVEGKVYVTEFFFTTCPNICPKMNRNMKKIYDVYKNNPDFLILSHTVNPHTDTVEQMKRYADSMGVDTKHWYFLTGTKEALYRAARESYLLDDSKGATAPIAEQFIHTQLFALVDKNGQVRGMVYDGLKKDEIERLIDDVKELLDEPKKETRFVNSIFQNNPK